MKMNHNYTTCKLAPPPVSDYSNRVIKFKEGVIQDTLLIKESVF